LATQLFPPSRAAIDDTVQVPRNAALDPRRSRIGRVGSTEVIIWQALQALGEPGDPLHKNGGGLLPFGVACVGLGRRTRCHWNPSSRPWAARPHRPPICSLYRGVRDRRARDAGLASSLRSQPLRVQYRRSFPVDLRKGDRRWGHANLARPPFGIAQCGRNVVACRRVGDLGASGRFARRPMGFALTLPLVIEGPREGH
jgi:hypothetical protein